MAVKSLVRQQEFEEFIGKYILYKGNTERAAHEVWPHLKSGSIETTIRRLIDRFPQCVENVREQMNMRGLTINRGLDVLQELLEAKRQTVVQRTGEVVVSPDYQAKQAGVNMLFRLQGQLQSTTNINIDKSQKTINMTQQNVNVGAADVVKELSNLNVELGLATGEQNGQVIDVKGEVQ